MLQIDPYELEQIFLLIPNLSNRKALKADVMMMLVVITILNFCIKLFEIHEKQILKSQECLI